MHYIGYGTFFLQKRKLAVKTILLNKICRTNGAMPSSLHREKNRKVSNERTLQKANGSYAEGPTTIKKRKGKKWKCCIGTSGAVQ